MSEYRDERGTGEPNGRGLTPAALLDLAYIAPELALAPYLTTLYHFRCDEPVIRDTQPAAVGQVMIFLAGSGDMTFASGRRDAAHAATLMTPTSRAATFEVAGPFHCIGAVLSPLGWAALTGLHAGEWADRLIRADQVFGAGVNALALRFRQEYADGRAGADLARELGRFLEPHLRAVNPRHAALIGAVSGWLASSLSPQLADLEDRSGYSGRQLQRLCERYFGLPPVTLLRKYRALRVVALLNEPGITDEQVAALTDQFYDQSHMIREIRTFAGRTPGRLAQDAGSILGTLLDARNFREIAPQIAPLPPLATEDDDA